MLPAAGSLVCGAIVLVPLSLVVDQPWTLAPSARSLLALICLSVFSTALAFTIYFRLIRTLGPVGTTSQAYLRVPIGVAIGVVFLGETLASDDLDRARLRHRRRGRDDDSGARTVKPCRFQSAARIPATTRAIPARSRTATICANPAAANIARTASA